VVLYLIESGGIARSRYEFRLARQVEEHDVFMHRTGVAALQVTDETIIAVDSVTGMQFESYAADYPVC
jgi:hypothetical protein